MFLAQASYAAAHAGRKLMPAVFVADELGPMETNIYLAFSKGKPDVDVEAVVPESVQSVLDQVWRRFGHLSAELLSRMTKDTPAYREALRCDLRSEIDQGAMERSIAGLGARAGGAQSPVANVRRTHDGRSVLVKGWVPGAKSSGRM